MRESISSEVKRPGFVANHSRTHSAEVKNFGALSPLPHTSSCRGACLIKHRHNLNFTFTRKRKEHLEDVNVEGKVLIYLYN
jgi:hypothetical protein